MDFVSLSLWPIGLDRMGASMSRKRGDTVTADYVNDLLLDIAALKNRNKKLEEVYLQVRRLTMTAIIDDDFPKIKADLEAAMREVQAK